MQQYRMTGIRMKDPANPDSGDEIKELLLGVAWGTRRGMRQFANQLKTRFGATRIEFRLGHFSLHGFFTVGEQVWYLSIGDTRTMLKDPMPFYILPGAEMLLRKAKGYSDSLGGPNQWVRMSEGVEIFYDDMKNIIAPEIRGT